MPDAAIIDLGLLLLVACVVAIVTRRLGFPYAIGLVATGLGLALAGFRAPIPLTRDLVFTVLLPPLVFEGALHLGWPQFRREAPLVLTIAFGGTLLSALVVAAGMHAGLGWGWPAAALFGALIAATDPVSVLALMKGQHTDPRLKFLMESESLVNDGAAAVLFALVIAWIAGSTGGAGGTLLTLVQIAGGGVLCGLVVAGCLLLVAGSSQDQLVETTLTVLAAYGSFVIAERLHMSGVLATLSAGMLVGNWGRGRWLSDHGAQGMIRLWDFFAFLANSVVFLLIGSQSASQFLHSEPYARSLTIAAAAIALVLAGRLIAVYPLARLFDRTALALPASAKAVMFWGGLRGALALALALGVPAALPEHDALIMATFAVVAFSIFVQGLTVPWLLRAART
ncbi:sodium:proton antiporter [Novosphingobium sp.]|uniref:cation:proton antiporter n=1 Tax=Novosphingobium sp. TaxID=1874826 RepID=UPI00333E1906